MKKDGMNYAPKGGVNRVVEEGEFVIAAMALDHGHIYGMCNGLVEAGATLKYVYDPDPAKVRKFIESFPEAQAADSVEQILKDDEIKLVAAAAIPSERGPLGVRVMESGKDYFTDKTPFTTLEQLEAAKETVEKTGKKYMVYYSERLHVESAVYVGNLIKEGAIGRVLQVSNLAPHLLNAPSRPEWFFQKEKYGGILCDIGSHQIEQFLYYSGNTDAEVVRSQVANYTAKEYPELEDFGDCMIVGANGATHYFRVDWLTPAGLGVWGDGRTFILGSEGYIEVRKYIDIARDDEGDQVYLSNNEGTYHYSVKGKVGFPFFGEFILDCINRTENAMTQAHAFKTAELCLIAQKQAVRLE
ncbi:Gfo/Idh/MocA family protein [Lederbergia citrea]|uniref:Gfo/Idh/MocA family oxidoreductase n=1 Tax=Lederbergia citrea TaxID=2833581 RepID=A0A942US56_9BACI|nr:Gfo/Idh/MocA family oxidoreductase [Lederbergia citrea]MBS4223998.1 Gfo/Idh/MocA family oxidoreductase [Lederbergia citrea]